eukprot:CAMPEP_0115427550 /NCGR_PEP_ID=MMETSP0271-20121206/29508_1 /TAXON_ID=71861 /ORGANISM="Scrippsiella trochoidea, Strain CCMP3099" /LENGTH=120 /DNA_ID=CAMNT_0002852593 /DNA_START=60 /DNA_END=422 /DNA_ORIENTATION=+
MAATRRASAARLPAAVIAFAVFAVMAHVLSGSPLASFVSAPTGGLQATSMRGAASPVARSAEEKSLFERTKSMNSKMSEVNGQNEQLIDTDNAWAIGYTIFFGLLTVLFVQFIYSFKPAP